MIALSLLTLLAHACSIAFMTSLASTTSSTHVIKSPSRLSCPSLRIIQVDLVVLPWSQNERFCPRNSSGLGIRIGCMSKASSSSPRFRIGPLLDCNSCNNAVKPANGTNTNTTNGSRWNVHADDPSGAVCRSGIAAGKIPMSWVERIKRVIGSVVNAGAFPST